MENLFSVMGISYGILGSIVGAAYISVSLILWRFPTLLHRKKRFKFPTLHCSHRGGAAEHLENTLEAFRHAVNMGTDLLELDCQLTKDGKVVVLHEANLTRLTGFDVNSHDVLFKDLPELKPHLWLHFDKERIANGKDRKIALLEDVFRLFPNVAINIDLKEGKEVLIYEVDRLIRKYNRADLCVWGNRNEGISRRCYEINPDVPLLFSLQKTFLVVTSFYLGLLPFIPLREGFMEVPLASLYLDLMPPPQSFYDRLIRFTCKAMDWAVFNRLLFAHLERRGIRVLVWVLQTPEQFDWVMGKGVHGIMTDYPTRLMEYFVSKGLRPSKAQSTPENNLNCRTRFSP